MGMLSIPVEDTAERLTAFETVLAAALPTRVVSPGFAPAGARSAADLAAGVVNVVAAQEGEYDQGLGGTAQNATTQVLLICHLQVDASDDCANPLSLAEVVRAAELALLAEIKTFCRTPIDGMDVLLAEVQFSRQLEAPFGWLVATLEIRPPVASTH